MYYSKTFTRFFGQRNADTHSPWGFSFSYFEKRLAYEVMTHDSDRGACKGQREPTYYVVSTLKAAVNHSKIKMVTSRGSRFIDPTVQYVNWKIESFFFYFLFLFGEERELKVKYLFLVLVNELDFFFLNNYILIIAYKFQIFCYSRLKVKSLIP